MATVAELLVRIGGDNSGLRRSIQNSQRQMNRAFGPDALALSEGAAGVLGALALAMGAVGLASIKMSADMQVSKTAFTKLLGSADAAKEMLSDLITFAADTPFEMPGLVNSAKKLLAYQFAAQDIIPIMASVGDAVALMGGGQEAIDGIVKALGQVQMKGKLSAEEVNQLAERNVNAWKYVAAELGVSIPQAMKLTEQGAVDATTAINGIVKGMATEFKGGMDGLSKEIPGLLSTMKDNVGAVMREIGDKITEAFDLKNKLQGAVDYLSTFASAVNSVGIKEAILGLVPPEATAAVFALGGALLAVAIPAMYMFAGSIWLAMAPMLPFIALGAAIGLLAYEIWKNWEPLSELFGELWIHISNRTTNFLNKLQTDFYTAISKVMNFISPLANLFGGSFQETISGWGNNAVSKLQALGAESDSLKTTFDTNLNAMGGTAKKFNIGIKNIDIAGLIPGGKDKPNTVFSGLHGVSTPTAGLAGLSGGSAEEKAAKETEQAWEKLESKAKQISDSIQKEWVQTTKTQLEQLEIWKVDELKGLDETAAANENYERDKERVAAVYSVRRTKIVQQEAKDAIDTFKSIRDSYNSIQRDMTTGGLTGSAKGLSDINNQYDDKAKSAKDSFDKITQDYATATDAQRKNILDSLNKEGIAYEKLGTDKIDLSKVTADTVAGYEKQKVDETNKYYATGKALQADLDEAYNTGNLASYQSLLNSKMALLSQDLAGRQELIDSYYTIWQDSHRTAMSYMAEGINGLYGGLTTFFTDIFNGTKSIGDAWNALGSTVGNMLAGMAAKWIASRIAMWAVEKLFGGKQEAAAVTQGAATALAWAPAAAMVSLATMGANAAPAMAGMALTTGVAFGLASIPALANGGITTGPALAQIGEGKYQEAVLPLNKKVFEKMGLTNNGDGGGNNELTIHVHAIDAKGTKDWLNSSGGEMIQKFFSKQAGAFAIQGG